MPADSYSALLGLLFQATGNNNNSWGTNANTNIFQILEKAVAGYATVAVTGGTLDYSGTPPPAAVLQRPEMVVEFTGALASDQIVKIPNLSKVYIVKNSCTLNGHALKMQTPLGALVTVPAGWQIVWCDGANDIYVGLSTSLRDTQWLGADGTIGAPGLSFTNEATLGWRRVSAGVMALTVGGVDILTVSATAITVNSTTSFSVVPSGVEVPYAGINVPDGWYLEYGAAVSRTTDANLFAAITQAFTGNTTNGSAIVTNLSVDLRGKGLEGATIECTGAQTATQISSVDSATQITLTKTVGSTTTGNNLRAFPYGNGDGSTTFNLPDRRGRAIFGRDNMGAQSTTGAGNITYAGSGIFGYSMVYSGGAQSTTLGVPNLPPYTPSGSVGTSISHNAAANGGYAQISAGTGNTPVVVWAGAASISASSSFTGTAQGGTSTPFSNMPPTAISNYIIKR